MGSNARLSPSAVAAVFALLAAGVAASVGLAAATSGASAAATTLTVEATGRNGCTPTTLSAPAGSVTIRYRNALDRHQSFGIDGVGVAQPEDVRRGESATLSTTLAAGTYTFWCGDDADDDDRMTGTLTVTGSGGTSTSGTSPPGGGAPPPPASLTVAVQDDFFSPASLRAAAGAITITVTNAGRSDHTWTIAGLVNVVLAPGQTKTVTFSAAAGTYTYFCAFHDGMRGTLTVEPPAGGAPGTTPTATTTNAATATTGTGAGAAAGAPGSVTLSDFAITPSTISVAAGHVTLSLRNTGELPHTFTIDGLVNVELQPGETRTVSFHASPGSYRVFCALPGHAGAGMVGTLVVAAPGSAPAPAATTTSAAPGAAATAPAGHAGHTGAARPAAISCRIAAQQPVSLAGVVATVSAARLVVHVTSAARTHRAVTGTYVAIGLTRRTAYARTTKRRLKAGDSVRVLLARCSSGQKSRVAMRVALVRAAAPAPAAAQGTVLALRADARGLPRFDKQTLEAPAGKITLRLTNPSPVPHNVAIEGAGAGKVVSNGGVSTVTVELRPGTYTFLCALPGHAKAGMKGTLVVK